MKKIIVTKPPIQNEDEQDESTVGCGCCMANHPTVDEFFGQITEDSTAHGIKYVGSKKLHPVERIFWVAVLCASTGCAIHLAMNVYTKFQESPVIVSFQAHDTPISRVPFPAITICNVNMLKTSVLTERYEELMTLTRELKDNTQTVPEKIVATLSKLDRLSQYCLMATSLRRYLNETIQDYDGQPDFTKLVNKEIDKWNAKQPDLLTNYVDDPTWGRDEMAIFKSATIGCREMLLKCKWAGQLVPCMEIFLPIETRNGRCCVFNMMPKSILEKVSPDGGRHERNTIPEKTFDQWKAFAKRDLIAKSTEAVANITYPKHQKTGGKPYGLTVMINPNLEEYSSCNSNDGWGFKIVAHSPLSAPSIMDYGAAIPPDSEVFVDVEPDVTVADPGVLVDIPLDKRGCYLEKDEQAQLKLYNNYSQENCFSECQTFHTFKNCSCVRYFMPRNESQKVCGGEKQKCATDVRSNLTKNFGTSDSCDHCMPPCNDIKYRLQMSHFNLREDNSTGFEFKTKSGEMRNATDYSILHIYMGVDSIYAKERKIIFGWFELISNAGGLLSLTLGVSIISFIEVGYFFTLRAWFKFRSVRKGKAKKFSDGAINVKRPFINRRISSNTALGENAREHYNWAVRNRTQYN